MAAQRPGLRQHHCGLHLTSLGRCFILVPQFVRGSRRLLIPPGKSIPSTGNQISELLAEAFLQ